MKLIHKIPYLFIFLNLSFAHGISESDKHEIVQGSLMDYLILGAKHMITGYDHILFLIGVIFFLTQFSDIVKFVSAFTIGHSITLIFATVFKVTANYYLIDAVIAFSVIYKGFENIGGFGSLRHGQDIELSNRIHNYGAKVMLLTDAIVFHRRRTTLKKFFRQVFNWGVARINLGKIDSSMLEIIHFAPSICTLLSLINIFLHFL